MMITGGSGCFECFRYVDNAPANAEEAFDLLDQQLGDSDSMWVGDMKVERDNSWCGDSTITVSKMYASPVSYDESRDVPLFKFSKDDDWFSSDEYSVEHCYPSTVLGEDVCVPKPTMSYISDRYYMTGEHFQDYARLFGLEIKDYHQTPMPVGMY